MSEEKSLDKQVAEALGIEVSNIKGKLYGSIIFEDSRHIGDSPFPEFCPSKSLDQCQEFIFPWLIKCHWRKREVFFYKMGAEYTGESARYFMSDVDILEKFCNPELICKAFLKAVRDE